MITNSGANYTYDMLKYVHIYIALFQHFFISLSYLYTCVMS